MTFYRGLDLRFTRWKAVRWFGVPGAVVVAKFESRLTPAAKRNESSREGGERQSRKQKMKKSNRRKRRQQRRFFDRWRRRRWTMNRRPGCEQIELYKRRRSGRSRHAPRSRLPRPAKITLLGSGAIIGESPRRSNSWEPESSGTRTSPAVP